MTGRDDKAGGVRQAAQAVRRQMRLGENARFLRRMPGFELDDATPNHFEELLGRLEEAERRAD